jgi:hypothetical protein
MLYEINNVIKNTHLSKIVLEYIEHELECEKELIKKTRILYSDSNEYINYDNYSYGKLSQHRLSDGFRYYYSKTSNEWLLGYRF